MRSGKTPNHSWQQWNTYNLMQHEALPMYLYTYPFDVSVDLRIFHFKVYHVPFNRSVIERLPDRVVMEITEGYFSSA